MQRVKDYMVKDFKLLSGEFSPQKAIAQLADSRYGVIVNAQQQRIGLITVAELETAVNQTTVLPEIIVAPWIVVGSEVELQQVANSPLLDLLVEQAKAAVAIDDTDSVVGILPADAVIQFIQAGRSQQKGTTFGEESNLSTHAAGLGGKFSPPTALCTCRECGVKNRISTKQWRALIAVPPGPAPPCQNKDPNVIEHPIRLT